MIRMVPSSKLPNSSDFDPNHSLAQQIAIESLADSSVIDFDLGYLPTVHSGFDPDLDLIPICSPESLIGDNFHLAPPSPSDQACLSPKFTTDLTDFNSVTMFSPDAKMVSPGPIQGSVSSPPCYVPSASPVSLPPSSPYSPACRPGGHRYSSTDSAITATSSSSSSTSLNLKENLEEFAELQRRIQQEQSTIVRGGQLGQLGGQSADDSVLKRALESGKPIIPVMEETKLASVLSMVMDDLFEHVRKEIRTQCALLSINPGEIFFK